MIRKNNVIIIGAGILGCFAARALSAYDLNITVLETREDACCGITRANTGIIYPGYDQHPGSMKSQMCLKASENFENLCNELDVPFRKCGLMMLSLGPNADKVLEKKLTNGRLLNINGLNIIGPDEIHKLEPCIEGDVKHALFSESTCVVDPWKLGIAALESARANGANFIFNQTVRKISRTATPEGCFVVETDNKTFTADRVLCCGGLNADVLWEMVALPKVKLVLNDADYVVYDTNCGNLINHIISVEPEEYGEGLTLVPTVGGNILLGPTRRNHIGNIDFSTEQSGINELLSKCHQLIPALNDKDIIRTFGAIRPNPYLLEGERLSSKSINDFLFLEENGFYNIIGVKTPGITCASQLGEYAAQRIVNSFEGILRNPYFNPHRKSITTSVNEKTDSDHEIICRCKNITKGEIIEAISRGATTINGIKRRCGAGMGRCQGGFCEMRIMGILAKQLGVTCQSITKDGPGSEIL